MYILQLKTVMFRMNDVLVIDYIFNNYQLYYRCKHLQCVHELIFTANTFETHKEESHDKLV